MAVKAPAMEQTESIAQAAASDRSLYTSLEASPKLSISPQGVPQPSGLTKEASLYATKISSLPEYDVRWAAAELRTAELLSRIQPNGHSEVRREAVAGYVTGVIQKCFDCEVFKFGSVPLKTYLPDGDIDLTAFSRNQNLRDTWAIDVQTVLKHEEQRRDAEFCVRDVQCIHAEVKIVKCLVENIVVDISFNQLGGLCTLCFLEEVDRLIQKNHLFKRSIILVKAWCYYESRLLGAHHGLISTYALETLVLYIFNVFHTNLRGPLEVLFTFLDYFSNFDWEKYCVSLWGPVPLAYIPDLTAEPPLRDGGKLLLSKDFLEACSALYDVFPKGQDSQARTFGKKFLNVVDPLRTNNNLGRSVSKANYFRIRSSFNLGARKLAKVFEASEDDFPKHLDDFFQNTWERHQIGQRPDAPTSTFPPYQIFVYKAGGLNVLAEDSADDTVGLVEQENCNVLPSSGKSNSCSEKTLKEGRALTLQSLSNSIIEDIISEIPGQKSDRDICLLDSSSVVSFSESCSSHENQRQDHKEDIFKTDMLSRIHVDLQKKEAPMRTNSLGEGLSMVQKLRHDTHPCIRRTISEGKLEKLSNAEIVKDCRLIGDAQGLAIKHLTLESDTTEDLRNSSGPMEGPKGVGKSEAEKLNSGNSNATVMGEFADASVTVHVQGSGNKTGKDLPNPERSGTRFVHESGVEGQQSTVGLVTLNDSRSVSSHKNKSLTTNNPVSQTPPDFVLPEPHDHLHAPYTHLFGLPSYVSSPGTSMFSPSPFVTPLPPLALDTEKASTSLADSGTNAPVVPLTPLVVAIPIPRGPVPPPLPSYVGVQSKRGPSTLPNGMDALQTWFHPQSFKEREQQFYFRQQHEQEQLQPFRPFQPWHCANASTSVVLPPSQSFLNGEMTGLELNDVDFASTNGRQGPHAIAKGSSGVNSLKGKGSILEHRIFNSKETISYRVQEKLSEPARADDGIRLPRNESADAGILSFREGDFYKGSEGATHPLPTLASGFEGYNNFQSDFSYPSAKTALNSSGSEMHNLPVYTPSLVQPLDKTTGLLEAIVPSTYEVMNPMIGAAQKPVGHLDTFQSPSPTESNAQEGGFGNQGAQGTPPVYFPPGPFPTVSYYNLPDGDPEGNLVYYGIGENLKASDAALSARFATLSVEEGTMEPPRDLLSSDLANHLQNLEFGRWCQEPVLQPFMLSPSMYHSQNYVRPPIFLEGPPHRPFQGTTGTFSQVLGSMQGPIPVASSVQSFSRMPNTLHGQGTFGISDLRKQQTGTGTFLPPRHGLYRDMQSLGGRYPQVAAHHDQGRAGNMGSLRQRSMGHGPNNSDGNSQITGAGAVTHSTGEGKHGDRNTWRKSQHLTSSYSPVMVAPPSHYGPFTGFPGINVSGSPTFEHGVVPLPPHHLPGRVLPLVPGQLEFGSLGPIEGMTSPGELNLGHEVGTVQPSRFSTAVTRSDAFSSISDRDLKQTLLNTQQRTTQGTYQLREDDFPPLPLQSQQGSTGNNRVFHH